MLPYPILSAGQVLGTSSRALGTPHGALVTLPDIQEFYETIRIDDQTNKNKVLIENKIL